MHGLYNFTVIYNKILIKGMDLFNMKHTLEESDEIVWPTNRTSEKK